MQDSILLYCMACACHQLHASCLVAWFALPVFKLWLSLLAVRDIFPQPFNITVLPWAAGGVPLALQHPVGGIVGLIIAMMVEVLLYAIIADRAEQKQRKRELKKKKFATASELASRIAQQTWAAEHTSESRNQPGSGGVGSNEGLRRRRLDT